MQNNTALPYGKQLRYKPHPVHEWHLSNELLLFSAHQINQDCHVVFEYHKGDYDKFYESLIVYRGDIAQIPGWGDGGGVQYEFPLSINILVSLGMLEEIK